MNNNIQNIYDNLSKMEKLKWNLGLGDTLKNLPKAKARAEREIYWYGKN